MIVPVEKKEVSPYIDLINKIEKNEVTLSFSSFKQFCESPRHFIQYKLNPKEPTSGMDFGTLVHLLILEGDKLEEKYYILPEDAPKKPTKSQLNAKNPSEDSIALMAWWEEQRDKAAGREFIDFDLYQKANKIKEYVYRNPSTRWVLDNITTTEQKLEWEYKGLKWRGYVDAFGPQLFADLKNMNGFNISKPLWSIRDRKTLWQGFLYGLTPECRGKDFYIVGLEPMPNAKVIRVKWRDLQAQKEEIDRYIYLFKKCVFERAWDNGYEYFTKDGFFDYSML